MPVNNAPPFGSDSTSRILAASVQALIVSVTFDSILQHPTRHNLQRAHSRPEPDNHGVLFTIDAFGASATDICLRRIGGHVATNARQREARGAREPEAVARPQRRSRLANGGARGKAFDTVRRDRRYKNWAATAAAAAKTCCLLGRDRRLTLGSQQSRL